MFNFREKRYSFHWKISTSQSCLLVNVCLIGLCLLVSWKLFLWKYIDLLIRIIIFCRSWLKLRKFAKINWKKISKPIYFLFREKHKFDNVIFCTIVIRIQEKRVLRWRVSKNQLAWDDSVLRRKSLSRFYWRFKKFFFRLKLKAVFKNI